jgi:hypothetical protein
MRPWGPASASAACPTVAQCCCWMVSRSRRVSARALHGCDTPQHRQLPAAACRSSAAQARVEAHCTECTQPPQPLPALRHPHEPRHRSSSLSAPRAPAPPQAAAPPPPSRRCPPAWAASGMRPHLRHRRRRRQQPPTAAAAAAPPRGALPPPPSLPSAARPSGAAAGIRHGAVHNKLGRAKAGGRQGAWGRPPYPGRLISDRSPPK